jgi:cytochrome c oxidase subunit 1
LRITCPADDRRARYGFSAIECVQFLADGIRWSPAVLQFLGGSGLYWRRQRTDIGWWAYAPLASRAFSPGPSSDYWTIAVLVAGFGSIGTAINLIATILCMRCPGMRLGRMPLLAWLNLTMAGLVLLAMTPLSAAQIMLLIDRYVGGHFFDTQAGGSATLWMHFFWIFGHPEVYVLVIPCFAFVSEIVPVFSRKPIFGYPVMVGATVCIAFVSMSVWRTTCSLSE